MTLIAVVVLASLMSSAVAQTPVASVALSPSGRYLALETIVLDRPTIALFDNEDAAAAPRLFNAAGHTITMLEWANERFLLIHTSQVGPGRLQPGQRDTAAGVEFSRNGQRLSGADYRTLTYTTLYALDTQSMEAVQMLSDTPAIAFTTVLDDVVSLTPAGERNRIMMHAPIWLDDPSLGRDYVATRNPMTDAPIRGMGGADEVVGQRGVPALWSVDLATGRDERIGRPEVDTRAWIVDAAGAPVARLDFVNGRYAISRLGAQQGRVELAIPDSSRILIIGLRADRRTLEAIEIESAGARRLRMIDLDTGVVSPFPNIPDTPITQPLMRDPATGLVDAMRGLDGAWIWIDQELGHVESQLAAAFDAPVEIVASSHNSARHVVRVHREDGTQVYYFDAGAAHAELLGPALQR